MLLHRDHLRPALDEASADAEIAGGFSDRSSLVIEQSGELRVHFHRPIERTRHRKPSVRSDAFMLTKRQFRYKRHLNTDLGFSRPTPGLDICEPQAPDPGGPNGVICRCVFMICSI